jgi:hypothetical protein
MPNTRNIVWQVPQSFVDIVSPDKVLGEPWDDLVCPTPFFKWAELVGMIAGIARLGKSMFCGKPLQVLVDSLPSDAEAAGC